MKKMLTLLLMLAFAHTQAQTVIHDANATKREIGSFHGIAASTGVEVVITKSDQEALAVSSSEPEYEKLIVTEVKDGILKIHVDADWKVWKMPKSWKIKVYVAYKQLDQLKASSGASIKGDLQSSSLVINQNSGGFMVLKGSVDKLDIEASSGGMFKGYDVTANMLNANVSSGGAVQVTVTKEVNAKASSGGAVNFKGDAVITNIQVSSGGSVKKVK